jgi:hypothetical protein
MKKLSLYAVVFFSLLILSCKKDKGTASLNVRLHDAPALYDSVKIDIQKVMVHTNVTGWITLNSNAGIYDLLTLQNGVDTLLVPPQDVPESKLSQIRFILGSNNTVVVSGTSYPLELSSQDESGLKLNIHQDLIDNSAYTIVIDFDAAQSIHETGNNTYKLKPVLSASIL